MGWRFTELGRGIPDRRPQEAELFKVGDLTKAEALVREFIQNALDASIDNFGTPVRVVFQFGVHTKTEVDRFYEGLLSHLKSAKLIAKGFDSIPAIPFLTIEDFHTTGLTGPVDRDLTEDDKPGNYCSFWWVEGKSGKDASKGGKWGVGKTAYHISSDLRSFWGLTFRDGNEGLLLGKTLTDCHKHEDGKKYDYPGYFANNEEYAPITDEQILEEFRQLFLLKRKRENGLSIVIPLPVEGIQEDVLIRWSIIHYFFPIIKQMLTVQVGDVIIEASTMAEIAINQDWSETPWKNENISSLMTFLEDAVTSSDSHMITLAGTDIRKALDETCFGDSLEDARTKFAAKRILWIRIPMQIKKKNAESLTRTYFDVFLQKDDLLKRAEEFYVRGGITISQIRKLGNRKIRALLSAQDDAISEFLGKSESPAHTDWKETDDRLIEYADHRQTLRFIKNAMVYVAKLVDRPGKEKDKHFLADLFSLKKQRTGPSQPPPPPPPTPKLFMSSRISGGFRISRSAEEAELPLQLVLKAAYDRRAGNPFKRYNPADFNFSSADIAFEVTGGSIISRDLNTLRASVDTNDFVLTVFGFDQNRDLISHDN